MDCTTQQSSVWGFSVAQLRWVIFNSERKFIRWRVDTHGSTVVYPDPDDQLARRESDIEKPSNRTDERL
jgi:hypothetical protein